MFYGPYAHTILDNNNFGWPFKAGFNCVQPESVRPTVLPPAAVKVIALPVLIDLPFFQLKDGGC